MDWDNYADYLDQQEREDAEDYWDDMDGDFDSALSSAGMGTDEDYGDYGQHDDYFDQ